MKASVQFSVLNASFERTVVNIGTNEGSGEVEACGYDDFGDRFDALESPANLRKLGQELIKLADFAEGNAPAPILVNYSAVR